MLLFSFFSFWFLLGQEGKKNVLDNSEIGQSGMKDNYRQTQRSGTRNLLKVYPKLRLLHDKTPKNLVSSTVIRK